MTDTTTDSVIHIPLEQAARAEQIQPRASPLKVDSLAKFLTVDFPRREMYLDPFLTRQSITMLYAGRGVGKTHVGLGVGFALASGTRFLEWEALTARRVLYVDGEMPGEAIKGRICRHLEDSNLPDEIADIAGVNFFIANPDRQEDGIMPDISTVEGQLAIEQQLDETKAEVLILDNLSCLVRSGRENESEGWAPIQEWLLRLRSTRGLAIVYLHHTGKDGQQRGSSKREDIIDTSIELRTPHEYTPDQGAKFIVKYMKARHMFGDQTMEFEAALGPAGWETKPLEDVRLSAVVTAVREAKDVGEDPKVRDISEATGIPKSTVQRIMKRAKTEGLIR